MKIRVFALAFALSLALIAATASAQTKVGEWLLDEGSGSVAHDSSGNTAVTPGQLDGAIGDYYPTNSDGSAPPVWVDGVQGKALSFDGLDDYLRIPIHPTFNFASGDFSVEAWVKTTAVSGTIVSRYSGSCGNWSLALSGEGDGKPIFHLRDKAPDCDMSTAKASVPINDGQWHHVAGVRSGNVIIIYVDGLQRGISDASAVDNIDTSYYVAIASTVDGRISHLKATIDKVVIYRGALSSLQVATSAGLTLGPVIDNDGDGYSALSAGRSPVDLDDDDAFVHPGATEVRNLVDDNCNGAVDEQNADLKGYWPMDEGSSIVLNDASRNQRNAYLGDDTPGNSDGDRPPQWITGVHGKALLFDGVDDYARALASAYFNVADGDFTVMAWVKTTAIAGQFVSRFSGSNGNWHLNLTGTGDGKPVFWIRDHDGNRAVAYGADAINDGEWHHLAGVRNGSTIVLYVDGAVAGTADATGVGILDRHYYLVFGATGSGTSGHLAGAIDDVALFGIALSADEIADYAETNTPPTADAGENLQIASTQQSTTCIEGSATDLDEDAMTFRWLEGTDVLKDWSAVSSNGQAWLDLSTLDALSVGSHTLTLEVSDGEETVSDSMILTVQNSPPEVQPSPTSQVIEYARGAVLVAAEASDFDGDTLTWKWLEGDDVLASGSVDSEQGGEAVSLPDLSIGAGDALLTVGTHQFDLIVDDGTNDPVSASVTVTVSDTTAPTLAPSASTTILWPPNHTLRTVTIDANASDPGGGAVVLEVSVISSEPPEFDGDGNPIPDFYIDSVNSTTGVIELRLRAERSGGGNGRTYTVTITATDESGNEAEAVVEVLTPHDRRKK